ATAPIARLDTAVIRKELIMGEAKLKVARADEEKASAEHAQARENLETLSGLQSGGHISEKEVNTARYQEKAAAAAVDAARARVAGGQANVAPLRGNPAQATVRAPHAGPLSGRGLAPRPPGGPP